MTNDPVSITAAGISLGWHAELTSEAVTETLRRLLNDPAARRAMSDRGRALVTGEGRQLVVEAMASMLSPAAR